MRSISTYADQQIITLIGKQYRLKRLQQKKSQTLLIKTLGISRPTVCHFEAGSPGVSLLLLINLLRIVDKEFLKGLIGDDSTNDKQALELLGKKYRLLRLDQNKTQKEIADLISVSLPTVSRFENGKGISLLVFIKLLRAVNKVDLFDPFLQN